MKGDRAARFHKLTSRQGDALQGIPWNVYPRPMMKRDSFFCLNGKWKFSVKQEGKNADYHEILVPFSPESALSGVECVYAEESVFTYEKSFTLPEGFDKGRVLLHFGAVDQVARVYLNGEFLTEHVGGYIPFTVELTEYLQDKNELKVEVEDHLSKRILPYGKQSVKRGGMWYTPVSGIWQTVWMESVPKTYIESVNADVVGSLVKISVKGVEKAIVSLQTPTGALTAETKEGIAEFILEEPKLWTPENPYLYHYTVRTEEDKVASYFAARTLSIQESNGIKRTCLNGKPYYFHGLLDQGYFCDGIFSPASPEAYTEEIMRVKALGFNTLRKHIKIEPQIFYAECDRLGMIVWQDMINNGDYKYVRDTVLPTIGFTWKPDKFIHLNKKAREAFLSTMKETVETLKSHPCICLWTIFNEGWGQFESAKAYRMLKEMDPTRFIDSTSGWFQGGESDLDSRHVYFRRVKAKRTKRPLVISEFGGFTYSVKGHIFNSEKEYGYGACETREEFVDKLRKVYVEEIIPAAKGGVCASIYTQVSDVEDEINGLFTYDRRVEKVMPEEFADIGELLQKAIEIEKEAVL